MGISTSRMPAWGQGWAGHSLPRPCPSGPQAPTAPREGSRLLPQHPPQAEIGVHVADLLVGGAPLA